MISIININKNCYICKNVHNLELHHIFFGSNRKKSDKDGLVVYLCYEHHRGTNGVHGKNGKALNLYLKKIAERAWLEYYDKTKEDFRKRYGRNYL